MTLRPSPLPKEQRIKQLSQEVEKRLSFSKTEGVIEFGTEVCVGQTVRPSLEQKWSEVKTENFDEKRDNEAQLFFGLNGLASAEDTVQITEMAKDFLRDEFTIEFGLDNRVELKVRQYSKAKEAGRDDDREPFDHSYSLVVAGDDAETYAQKIQEQFGQYVQKLRGKDSYKKSEGSDLQRLLTARKKKPKIVWG